MPVPNWRGPLLEKVEFITPDGETFALHNGANKMLLEMQGWGFPKPKFSTSQGAFQHGVTPTAIRETSRKVRMRLRASAGCRTELWTERNDLVDALRRNRASLDFPEPGALRWYRADGTIRQLDVFVQSGPEFRFYRNRRDPFVYEEQLDFIAHNPIIYNPTQQSVSQTGFETFSQEELQFPTQFDTTHIVFGIAASTVATWLSAISYAGNWEEYPIITIVGPTTNPLIENQSTGLKIELNYTLASGEAVTFNLTYGTKTITNNFGDSLLGYLTSDSDLAVFSIQPNPLVSGGINNISIQTTFSNANTSATISWFDRYIGI